MGFEYKLRSILTNKQINDIQFLLLDNITFDKKYKFDNKVFWEFREAENNGKLPNVTIVFENDGIYICQYGSSYLWTNLDKLKDYIKSNKIEYQPINYQE
ncbi:hypothetical protein KUL118_66510 [Tenacibaculum sp. KUL118]|nr:hypothetical protein KUL118_66510 [Tenacibaculum sp. KUL118]